MSSNIFTIANYTFKEIIQSKILVAVIALAAFIALFSFVASEFSYGVPAKVALDFGLGLLSFALFFISIFIGAFLLKREIDSRTLYLLLARPVSRTDFYLGKMLGLALFLGLVSFILVTTSYSIYYYYDGVFSPLFFYVLVFTYLKAVILFFIVVMFSLIVSPAINVFISIVIWLCSYAVTPALELSYVKRDPILESFLKFMHTILPDFYNLNLKEVIIYELELQQGYLLRSSIYIFFYLCIIFCISYLILRRKNFD